MALALYDRVQQTGTANTTVSFTLSGSVTGFQSFAVVGNGNTTYYSAFDASGNWEVGLGTYSTTGPTLTRTTILSSSNSGSAVTFSGTVNVFVTYPSVKSVNLDASGNATSLGTPASFVGTNITGTASGLSIGGNAATATTATNQSGGTVSATSIDYSTTLTGGTGIVNLGSGQFYKDASGNVGVGATTIAWNNAYKPIQFNSTAPGNIGSAGDEFVMSSNAYNNSGWKYQSTGYLSSYYMQTGGTHRWFYAPSGTAGNAITFTEAMRITSAGGISFGSSGTAYGTSGQVLVSAGNAAPSWTTNIAGNAANVTGTVAIGNGGSGQTTAQAAMNAFAGAVTSGSYLRGNGTNVVMSTIQAADVPTLNQNTTGSSGSCTGNAATATTATTANALNSANSYTAVSFIASSDERLKTNWAGFDLDFVSRLANVKSGTYERISSGNREAGVTAQSLKELLPEAVVEGADGMLSVNYGAAALVAAIELAKEVKALRAEIAQLKAK